MRAPKRTRSHAARRAGAVAAAAAAAAAAMAFLALDARGQLSGELGAHDPSSVIKDGDRYYYFATGPGVISRSSADRTAWVGGASIFGASPAWTTQAVPSFAGFFWAPDVAYFNGKYHAYYSVSSWGTIDSAIGLVTSPSLVAPIWTDQGKVVQSDAAWEAGPNTDTTAFNAIDPSVLVDNATGRVWMSFGSYSSGILVTELNPATGKRLNTSSLAATLVANNAPGGGWGSSIEGSALINRGGFYYLFVNYGGCCAGVNSTYDIRVGRSTSPTGPFLDKSGINMTAGGGSMFLDDDGRQIGPGHFGYIADPGQDYFSYHYYNGDANGAATFGMRKLHWTADAWPSYAAVNPDWTGATGIGWSAGANWSGATVPNGVGHVASFGSVASGRYLVSLDGVGRTVGKVNFIGNASYTVGNTGHVLTLDAEAGDNATINVQSGSHTIAAPVNAVDSLGVNVMGGSTLNLSGAVTATGLTKYGHGTLALNTSATFSQPLLVKWGFLEVNGSATANAFTAIGHAFAEGGVMVVRGSGNFAANADLNIGDTGNAVDPATGSLELHDNANVTINAAGGFFVGSGFLANTRASGTVHHHGGTLTANGNFDGAFVIGGRNSHLGIGTYNLNDGLVNANTNVQVGGRGTGTMNQQGGTFNAGSFVSVGRHAGATGAWNVSGGALNVTNPARLLIIGEAGAGTLTVSGAGHVTTAAPLRLGHVGGGVGVVNLDDGMITTPTISRGGGSATFNFNGGTLRAGGNSATFMQGLTAANVKGGGAVIDSNGFAVTVAQPLLAGGSGGLTKAGAGTLTLNGVNTYTGPTVASGGKLVLGQSLTTSSTVAVLNDATLELANDGTRNKILNTGEISLASNASIDLRQNKLLTTTPAGSFDGSTYTGVQRQVARAYHFGAWDQPGLKTSEPHAGQNAGVLSGTTTIGVAAASQVLFIEPGETGVFAGQTVTGATTIAMYTYAGDVNFDGLVDGADNGIIDNSVQFPGTDGYANGDFNYDGIIDGADYGIIDNTIQLQGAPFPGWDSAPSAVAALAAVPEPSASGLAGLAATVSLARRRRRLCSSTSLEVGVHLGTPDARDGQRRRDAAA